ncbi:serine protease [Streptomyces sp. NPDC048057]|uniref:S1 family peptidase n=1 Tax=Streptomyces sp. NPDC048057 TaxID=3155628 RepID=UPI0033E0E6DD
MHGERALERVAMVVRRAGDGPPRFSASGWLLAPRLVVCAGHGFPRPGDGDGDGGGAHYEVRLPGLGGDRVPVAAVVHHREPDVDLALLVLDDGGPALAPARWGVLPEAVGAVPFVAVGFPDHASRRQVPTTRQLTGEILLGSFLGSDEMELSLSSPAPRQADGSPWQGVSGAGVVTPDGVLVGVCTSHHVPSGAASLTATGFARLDRDPDLTRLLAEHAVVRVPLDHLLPPAYAPVGRGRIRPHTDVVRGLLGRRSYLDQDRLPFVHPGTDHASHPDRLFARLGTPGARGALLIGPAGSGKTRTCFEVAQRAVRAGWHVLHVQSDSAVTVDDVARTSLTGGHRRVLLVMDYLDACPQVDLRVLADELLPQARRRGVALACVASVRPGSLRTVQRRGSSLLLDEVFVREDWAHQSAVIAQVVRCAAPETVRRWGDAALARLCGRRPVTALLIARAIEEQGLARRSPAAAAGVRPGELLDWLREGMRRDALTADADPGGSPLSFAAPDVGQLAFTVAVAASPQPRRTVEHTVDAFLAFLVFLADSAASAAGSSVPFDGRRVVDTLLSLGWLDEVGDRVVAVHDVVTDELLLHSLMPPPGWSTDTATAGALFAALTRHAHTFSVFTGHLRRIAADLTAHGPTHRIAALERFCGEWLTARAQQLGQLLADAGEDGGQALLAMVTSGPWREFDAAVWDVLVAPWLARAEADHTARPFLTAALHSMDVPPPRLVEAAVGWLVRRGGQTDTEHLLLALLERPDLAAGTQDLVVEAALEWVLARPSWRHTPVLWKRLLVMDHPEERWERVAVGVSAWLSPYRTFKVASVARAFLQRPGVEPAVRRAFMARVVGWLRSGVRPDPNIGPTLSVLLELDDVPGSDRAELVRWALDWLDESWTHSSRGRVLRALLALEDCPRELRPRLLAFARRWAAETPAESSTLARVLHTLLTDEDAPDAADTLLARLDASPDAPTNATVLLRLLINHAQLDGKQVRAAVGHALAWLADHPEHESFSALLAPLLSLPGLPPEQHRRAVDLGCAALPARGEDHALMAVLLSQTSGVTPRQARSVAEVGLDWLARHEGKPQRSVLASFLTRTDLPLDQARIGIDIALDRLATDRSTKSDSLFAGVLRHPALDEGRRDRAADCALRWLDEHGALRKAHRVIRELLALPGLASSRRGPAEELAAAWRARHGDPPPPGEAPPPP